MELQSDTNPKIAALQHTLLREATPARKLAILGQMNERSKFWLCPGFSHVFQMNLLKFSGGGSPI
ncbi:MAG: hypothetical protein ACYC36_10035 [Bellilinea sp.]